MNEKADINNRFIYAINTLLQDKGLTKTSIANSLGIKPSKFSEILNGRMNAGTDTLALLCDQFSFNTEWLLLGRGSVLTQGEIKGRSKPSIAIPKLPDFPMTSEGVCEMFLTLMEDKDLRYKKQAEEVGKLKEQITKEFAYRAPDGSKVGIPLLPIEAMAGALTSEQTVLEYECERYVIPVFKGADFLIPVKGSSMYPKYSSGDIVACQRVPMSDLFFQWNKVYVIDTTQGPLIKRIKPGSDKDHVLIVSDNEKYDPFELPYSAIRAVALVIGVIRLE